MSVKTLIGRLLVNCECFKLLSNRILTRDSSGVIRRINPDAKGMRGDGGDP